MVINIIYIKSGHRCHSCPKWSSSLSSTPSTRLLQSSLCVYYIKLFLFSNLGFKPLFPGRCEQHRAFRFVASGRPGNFGALWQWHAGGAGACVHCDGCTLNGTQPRRGGGSAPNAALPTDGVCAHTDTYTQAHSYPGFTVDGRDGQLTHTRAHTL